MAGGIVCQLLARSFKLHISNKYTVVDHRLKTIAELKAGCLNAWRRSTVKIMSQV